MGLYGVMAFSTTPRTRELGVRVALGARHGQVAWLVVAQGLWQVGIGLALGLALAAPLSRLATQTLFVAETPGMGLFDTIALTLVTVGLAGSVGPAVRTVRLDPMTALRHE